MDDRADRDLPEVRLGDSAGITSPAKVVRSILLGVESTDSRSSHRVIRVGDRIGANGLVAAASRRHGQYRKSYRHRSVLHIASIKFGGWGPPPVRR